LEMLVFFTMEHRIKEPEESSNSSGSDFSMDAYRPDTIINQPSYE
jgi:hypothetical protein